MKDRSKLRRFVHRIANKRLYQWGADLLNAVALIRVGGLGACLSLKQKAAPPGAKFCQVSLKNIPHPIHFRPGTADANTIVQSLVRREYGMFKHPIDAVNIIDAGSFIGDASIFFHGTFPKARIVALEPNAANHTLAALNLKPYADRVTLLNAGLWNEPATLSVTGESTGSRLVAAPESGAEVIRCTDINTIMSENGFTHLDILKLDIEGAEREVFGSNYERWLPVTKLVIIEFHGDDIERTILDLLGSMHFECYRYRSLFYCYNSQFAPLGRPAETARAS